jgi:hypothetical protein
MIYYVFLEGSPVVINIITVSDAEESYQSYSISLQPV